jgi:hypothetical protein
MNTTDEATRAAREIINGLRHGRYTAHANDEESWKALQGAVFDAVKPFIDDAYAAGKADGIRESEAEKRRVFELGKAEGKNEAQGQT